MHETKTVRDYIRTIPDFPVPGIQFRDVTTLFNDATGFRLTIDGLANPYTAEGLDVVVGLDARGFIIGGAVAYKLGLPFVAVRKAGKLPGETIKVAYALEYGEAEMEIHQDAIHAGSRVLLVDDLLATGGTAIASIELIEKLGGVLAAAAFIVDLPDLGGSNRLRDMGVDLHVLCEFEGD
ncbi:MAG: adenine phosphoribosyltransferase [Pseudomonadota bacterium]